LLTGHKANLNEQNNYKPKRVTSTMTFTICLTVYGRPVQFEKTLQSVKKYVCPRWPIVLIFSEHSEFTYAALETLIGKFLADRSVKVRCVEPTGVYSALNAAILEVRTDYFTFCHSDDEYIRPVNDNTLDYEIISEYDIYTFPVSIDGKISYPRLTDDFSYDISINHMCTFFKTSTHKQYIYDTNYKYSADWDAVLRMHSAGAKISEGSYTFLSFNTQGLSSQSELRRLKEDLSIILRTKWTLGNVSKKITRVLKEIGGFIIGKIKHNYYHSQ
jgi:glycosyltransferase involved in cell wall biosynthesis